MRQIIYWAMLVIASGVIAKAAAVSSQTETCIDCHVSITPGIVADWLASTHARISPAESQSRPGYQKRVSSENIPESLSGYSVGCAECHLLNAETHKDSFNHNDFAVHTVVTPNDCAVCHQVEAGQYQDNIMAWAYTNLMDNNLYQMLVQAINGIKRYSDSSIETELPDDMENAQSCLSCHGTVINVAGKIMRETDLGEMEFPILEGWPNQGVGRINPDNSRGSCAACHTRHQFSIETARKPYTCAECHKGPDVPAYNVYMASKHGQIYATHHEEWDFAAVPWRAGTDFTAPTCAACHISLLSDGEGNTLIDRSHSMHNRLSDRLFGLIYSHPYPKNVNTSLIKNRAGLSLPTELTGEPAGDYLIDATEQSIRRVEMQKTCRACHSRSWIENHFAGLEQTKKLSDEMTKTATMIMMDIWNGGRAQGLSVGASIFDENIEKMWIRQWLFYANSCRLASAMAGTDLGVFDNGRWNLSENIQSMLDWLKIRK